MGSFVNTANIVTAERFLNDVSKHEMIIKHDQGVYRNIRFRNPESSVYSFNLTTWPGCLTITGDMGSYAFSRIPDMFDFFRPESDNLWINPDYWQQKVVAQDVHSGIKHYSPDKFRDLVNEEVHEYIQQEDILDEEEGQALQEAVKLKILEYADETERAAKEAAMEFVWRGEYPFQEFWEHDCKEYATRFLWCCYAIVWGILQYDQAKVVTSEV